MDALPTEVEGHQGLWIQSDLWSRVQHDQTLPTGGHMGSQGFQGKMSGCIVNHGAELAKAGQILEGSKVTILHLNQHIVAGMAQHKSTCLVEQAIVLWE